MARQEASEGKVVETDALIESSFRRLLTAIESERDQIRGSWQRLQQERETTTSELERLKIETEEWCRSEQQRIDQEWKRLDKLSEKMSDMWPQNLDIIEINCSGEVFTLPKQTLCSIEGSVLSQMFSDTFIKEIPKDEQGRFYLDFNPQCFSLVVEYLRNRRLRRDAPLPVVPQAQQLNMELLAEAWKLKPFLRENRVNPVHGTSLYLSGELGNQVRATHPGWQVISAQYALPMAGPSYFEVRIRCNPDAKGGLAIGVCARVPQGPEIHSIRLPNSVMYNSGNGLIGDCFDPETTEVTKGLKLVEGESIGVRHEPGPVQRLLWYHNRTYIGCMVFKPEFKEQMRTVYPVFALYVPEQSILVDFRCAMPPLPGKK